MPDPEAPPGEHWYEVVDEGDDSLRQGDIFRDLVVYWLPDDLPTLDDDADADDVELTVNADRGDWIVLTASCDLHQERFSHALLAGVAEASYEGLNIPGGEDAGQDELDKYQEVVRAGLDPTKFMLPSYEGIEPSFPRSVAFIRTNVFLPLPYLKRNCTDQRLRLNHPFREKFGNWVGQRFSAVGPEDYATIPRIRQVFPEHILQEVQANEIEREPGDGED